MSAWESNREDVVTVLNVNGVEDSQFFDDDEFDEFVDGCIGSLSVNKIEEAASEGTNKHERSDLALAEIETQLRNDNKIN